MLMGSHSHSRSSVIIVGAGVSGISAAKVLAKNGIEDVVILEASDRIGGRMRKESFGGVSVELGAGWIVGVGGKESNPLWELAAESGLRTFFSDYSNARYNIYDRSGRIFPSGIAADSYKKAVDSAIQNLRNLEADRGGDSSMSRVTEPPSTPIELAIDFILHDFEMAEVEPISTFVDFGEREFLVADERGYEYLLYKMAEDFLYTSEGRILDNRLKLNQFEGLKPDIYRSRRSQPQGVWAFLLQLLKGYRLLAICQKPKTSEDPHSSAHLDSQTISPISILNGLLHLVVREIQHSRSGVRVVTEAGCVYEANYVILSVSIGVLQSDLIAFDPPLPNWKLEAIQKCDVMVYTKIFLKFPNKFWPNGPEKEFFIYAHDRRGYYTFWQHMENAYPGSNILVVTLTNGESKRVEAQSDEDTLREAMVVLRDMFGPDIPDAIDILVPRWWNNRFQRGSYSNYPIISNPQALYDIKAPVGRIFFTGEHTSERFSGYVHGGYLAGIDSSKALLEEVSKDNERESESQTQLVEPLVALTESLTTSQSDTVSNLHKCDIPTQLYLNGKLGMAKAIL